MDTELSAPADRSATVQLNTGRRVPAICFGGGMRVKDPQVFEAALSAGFRFFDTAFTYRNDHLIFSSAIGRRLVAEQRADVAVCTKNTLSQPLPGKVEEALDRMGLEHLDLLLLHHPVEPGDRDPLGRLAGVWAEMEQLVDDGLVHSLGVSNTGCSLLQFILDSGRIPPAVDQVEFHPHLLDTALLAKCESAGIRLQAYCPLGSPWRQEDMGKRPPGDDPVITAIARDKGRSPAQVILRWLIEKGVIPVVSATQPAHMRENLDVFDFELSAAEHQSIDGLGRSERIWRDEHKLAGLFGTVAGSELRVPPAWPQ